MLTQGIENRWVLFSLRSPNWHGDFGFGWLSPSVLFTAVCIFLCIDSSPRSVSENISLMDKRSKWIFLGQLSPRFDIICLIISLQWKCIRYYWSSGGIIPFLAITGLLFIPPCNQNHNIWGVAVFAGCDFGSFFFIFILSDWPFTYIHKQTNSSIRI